MAWWGKENSMPVTVRDVLQMECLSQARVVAGERGLDREVY